MSGFADLAEILSTATPRVDTGGLTIATTVEKIFVYAQTGEQEGICNGFWFFSESEDYQTSPVKLVTVGLSAIQNSATVTGNPVAVYTVPVARGDGMFFFPFPYGIPIYQGQTVALQAKNNEASSIYFEGRLSVVTFSRNALRSLPGASGSSSALSPGGLSQSPFGSERLFCQ